MQGGPTAHADGGKAKWFDRKSSYSSTNDRAKAEEELLSLYPKTQTTVMNLPGLWGGERDPQRYLLRAVPTKEALAQKVCRLSTVTNL